jgi:hypothetical protein
MGARPDIQESLLLHYRGQPDRRNKILFERPYLLTGSSGKSIISSLRALRAIADSSTVARNEQEGAGVGDWEGDEGVAAAPRLWICLEEPLTPAQQAADLFRYLFCTTGPLSVT